MIIRKTERRDLPALLDIYNDEVEHGVATLDLHPRTAEQWDQWFADHSSDTHFILTAEIDGTPAGYASLSEYRSKEAYASTVELSIYVGRDFRRKGVASALMEAILKIARENPTIHSVVSVITSGNEASARIHEKFGFRFCGTLHEVGLKMGALRDIDNYELLV